MKNYTNYQIKKIATEYYWKYENQSLKLTWKILKKNTHKNINKIMTEKS